MMAREDAPLRLYWTGGETSGKDALGTGRPIVWVTSSEDADLVVSPPASSASDLTDREAEVLGYLADGWSNEEIADRLGIGVRTVRFHLDHVYCKLGVGRRTEAVREAVTRGYLRL